MTQTTPFTPTPSATLMLGRDGQNGIEVFMVLRNKKIDFAGGALVFPGGKVSSDDRLPEIFKRCDGGASLTESELSLRIAAIRETFEESGILLARCHETRAMLSGERVAKLFGYRTLISSGKITLKEFLETENLTLACDRLTMFAHWITPEFVPKRFDVTFFLAEVPENQSARHDGVESVDSVWITAGQAISDADSRKRLVVFPTRMNLLKLDKSRTVSDAIALAKSSGIVTVTPRIEERETGKVICIPKEAGYDITEAPLAWVMGEK